MASGSVRTGVGTCEDGRGCVCVCVGGSLISLRREGILIM